MIIDEIIDSVSSLYIHFPFCKHLCNYCDFFKKIPSESNNISNFEEVFLSQYMAQEKIFNDFELSFECLDTLYIGGGTPSLWGNDGADFLKDFFSKKRILLNNDGEFTLELNPGAWSHRVVSSWEDFGVNRFSIGIQSLDHRFLPILDRVHKIEESLETLQYFSKRKLNFSVDFMLGLPFSEELGRDVLSELENVLSYGPSHISLYILTTGKGYIHKEKLPKESWIEDEYLKVSSFLKEKGFLHYEVSNFALPGKESLHNLKYWGLDSVAALGPSGTGFLKRGSNGLRYKWNVNGPTYSKEVLGKEELLLERVYLNLRTLKGVNPSTLFPSEKIRSEFFTLAEKWNKNGFLESFGPEKVSLSTKGYLLLDSLMDDLFIKKIV